MYNITTITDSFIDLIGFRQSADPSVTTLSSLTTSDSGLYYQAAHPFITLINLESIAPLFGEFSHTAYDVGTEYSLGDIVSSGGVNYKYINATPSTGNAVTDSTYWDNLFTDWLKSKVKDSINTLISTWFEEKYRSKSSRNLLADTKLFYVDGFGNDTDSKTGFKSFEISPKRGKGLKYKISNIGIQFPSSESITLELRKVGNPSAIATQAVSYTGSGEVQWVSLTGFEFDGDGTYYVGYSDAVTFTNGVREYSSEGNGVTILPKSSKYFVAKAMVSTDLTSPSARTYYSDTNFGLNPEIEVSCDYTDLIVDHRLLFKNALLYQFGLDMVSEMMYNPNANVDRHTANISNIPDEQIMLYEIHGDTQGKATGLRKKLNDALNAVKFDESALSADCMMCRKRGVKYRSI